MQTTGTERLRAELKQAAAPQMKAEEKSQAIFQSSLDVLLIVVEEGSYGEAKLIRKGHDLKKIVLIEDNEDNLILVSATLEDLYEIIAYRTGAEGLAGLRRAKPDLVLLDISLPGMDGLEVLKEIRTDSVLRDLRVIALTAHAMEGDREALLAAGFNDYVVKPIIEEQRLLDTIASLFA